MAAAQARSALAPGGSVQIAGIGERALEGAQGVTVYVDDMRAPYGRMLMSHMMADSEDELHAMADRIGVAQRWYQGDHYDICQAKRRLAVAAGAVEVTPRELVRLRRAHLKGLK